MQRALLRGFSAGGVARGSLVAASQRGMGTAMVAARPAAGAWQARQERREPLPCWRRSWAAGVPVAGGRASYASAPVDEGAGAGAASRLPGSQAASDPEAALEAALEKVADAGDAGAAVAEVAERSWYMAPSYALESFLTGMHEMTGLPWWATIMSTGLLMRFALLPLGVYTVRNTAKMAELKPHIEAIKAKSAQRDVTQMDAADKMRVRKEAQAELANLWKKAGVHPMRSLAVGFAQAPFFIYFFWTLRRMSETCPEFQTGGTLWFPDISIADPFYGLPCFTTLCFLANTELMRWLSIRNGAELGRQQVIMGWFMRALAFILLPITANFPAAVHLYWATSNASSALQTLLWRSKKVRELLDLPDSAGLMSSTLPAKKVDATAQVVTPARAWKQKKRKPAK